MPSDETYVVDLTNEDVIDLTKDNDQVSQSIGSSNSETVKTKHQGHPKLKPKSTNPPSKEQHKVQSVIRDLEVGNENFVKSCAVASCVAFPYH